MCHKYPTARLARLVSGAALAYSLFAQTAPQPATDWRKVGGASAELLLASPATGPVENVWFSGGGSTLYARTASGLVFETADFEHWLAASNAPQPPAPMTASAARLPDPGAKTATFPWTSGRIFAMGKHLYSSEDNGRSWADLTAFKSDSVIGTGQHAVAVSPQNPDEIVAADDYGVWRSMDGGLSWAGLNQTLPAFPPQRILAVPQGGRGTRILAGTLGVLELIPGAGSVWQPAADSSLEAELQQRRAWSEALGANITAVASSGETVYAGASDGRIFVSFDAGRTWPSVSPANGNPVERLFVDSAEPRVALAALGGTGTHVLRTTNSGVVWDDLTGNLPDAPVWAVTADRAAGAAYVATDKGVWFARADLENASSPAASWTLVTSNLPAVAATDVRLDAAGNQLYIALQGYGIYAAAAPHRAGALRIVNAADLSSRPAAPGSLLSVIGGSVNSARGGSLDFPVLTATAAGAQIQVPFETSSGNLSLALVTGQGQLRFPLAVQPVSPAIFVCPEGSPMLLDADSGLILDAHNAARAGGRIQVLATGMGRVRPDWPTGLAAPLENPPAVVARVQAYLDRVPVEVTRAVLAPGYVGFYLVELQLPATVNAGPAELYLAAGGQESNRVQVFLEP